MLSQSREHELALEFTFGLLQGDPPAHQIGHESAETAVERMIGHEAWTF